jgi:hypothetical protein
MNVVVKRTIKSFRVEYFQFIIILFVKKTNHPQNLRKKSIKFSSMKLVKIILGILLFVVPIGLHLTSTGFFMMAPIGALATDSGDTSFAVHTFKWYSDEGRVEYILDWDNAAEIWASLWMMQIEFLDTDLSITGIFTVIILFAIALYVLLSFFKDKSLSLVADIIMIACAVMALIAFLIVTDDFGAVFDTNIPIFTIVAGILGLLGLFKSWKQKK